MKRRKFIQLAATTTVGATMASISEAASKAAKRHILTPVKPVVENLPEAEMRTWLGREFWANRLQDWRLNKGRIECLRGDASFEVRTFSLITRSLLGSPTPGRLQVRVGCFNPEEEGFCGFLLGVGAGKLDYRASALAHNLAGEGGGFLAVMDTQGDLSFRDFSNQDSPLDFEILDRKQAIQFSGKNRSLVDKEIILDCHLDPVSEGLYDIRLVATDARTHQELGFAVRTSVPAQELLGGISIVSSPEVAQSGSRWWFSDVATGGEKIGVHPERAIGPVMGCMHSLNREVLRLTAQFMPVSLESRQFARMDYRPIDQENWIKGSTSRIEEGYVALFRFGDWQPEQDHEYRIVYPDDESQVLFSGKIPKDPETGKELKIALYSCIIPTANRLDQKEERQRIPQERKLGRYQPENILFPHTQLVTNCDSHKPDLYLFVGDQYYEGYPTRFGRDTPDAKLDTLYRWYLWYWTFRETLRNRPCIMLADDHDILQGNLWGDSGKNSAKPTEEEGGFKWDKSLVRMVYRMQHGHNPDAYNPEPIAFDIPVAYGNFIYGGVNFALVEDRKFKTPPDYDSRPELTRGELLGERQEAFLKHWKETEPGMPKICVTASIWGSPQTRGVMEPLLDYDANGYPPDGRTRAVKLVSDANALVLAGDQHLGMLAVQGVDGYEDGSLFFAGPAAAAFWQRWFEAGGQLDNQRNGDPNTGNFIDTFGNKMRVLAVANPKITYEEFAEGNQSWGMFLSDRRLKSEGYGIIRVDHQKQHYQLECWPWDANPVAGEQFSGWPYIHPFKTSGI